MSKADENLLPALIATNRLKLRPFEFSDVPEFYACLQDPEMGLYLEGPDTPPALEQTAQIVARHMLVDRSERGVWAITLDDIVIGACSINFAKAHRIAEIGYSVRKSLWGQGYAREAVQAVIDAAFATYPALQRIQAGIHPHNEGSIRVATRVGMVYEGTLRAYAWVRGELADEAIYAVVRGDSG